MVRIILPVLVALVAHGCALVEAPSDPASPFSQVPVGSTLELHQPLEIRPGSTRVWLQRGQVAAGRDWHHPACNLEVGNLDRERTQIVEPDRFTVRRVQQMMEVTEHQQSPGNHFLVRAGRESNGEPWMWLGYHLWLESQNQPDVRRMTCLGSYDRAWRVLPPSVSDIQAAFGDIASLKLHPHSGSDQDK